MPVDGFVSVTVYNSKGFILTWRFTDARGRTIDDLPIAQDGRPTCCTTLLLSADGVFLIELLSCDQLAGFDQLRDRRGRVVGERILHEAENQ